MAANGQARSSQQAASVSSSDRNDDGKKSELDRKRARDRKSQQAMRDRTKWQLHNMNEQVRYLTQVVEEKNQQNTTLRGKVYSLEAELEHLKIENGALRLGLMREASGPSLDTLPRWQIPPSNIAPTCLADQIIQSFIASGRAGEDVTPSSPAVRTATYADKPNLCLLLDRSQRPADALSNIVGDIVLSYKEIETLPKQVSVFYALSALLKWELLLDEASWKRVPSFLRPTQQQLSTPHAAWIDRIPWPQARKYLIEHPSITLDDFAVIYSTNFNVSWPYDPRHVVLEVGAVEGESKDVTVNPVFLEHLNELQNWTVTDAFRMKFPEIADAIDTDIRAT